MARVYAGMSGGVDSSVTAALLKEAGHEVVGVYMKNWTQDVLGFQCPWRQDLADAQSVAARLGISFKIFDFEAEYRDKVVDYLIAEYRAGRTPNPDIMCNQEVKFKLFLEAAIKDGAEMIATGHYARTKDGQLLRGKDADKDQSYFLHQVTSDALNKTLFPLGEYTKPEVRKLAQERELATAAKPDSQGICFIGEVNIVDFLRAHIPEAPGPIKKLDGTVVGEHIGAAFYTIGQRHGLGVGGGMPLYVVDKDMTSNTVYVTDQLDDPKLQMKEFTIRDVHWINDAPQSNKDYEVQVRYRAKTVPATLEQTIGDRWHVVLRDYERAVTPGQSAVVYEDDRVLGGGIIVAM